MNIATRDPYRFSSRSEYERELSRLISLRNSLPDGRRKSGPTTESVDDEYDSVMEEYLAFCSEGVG